MRRAHLSLLICPECRADQLSFKAVRESEGDVIREGSIVCDACAKEYPILKSIPRFVPIENYASSFGFEWLQHARTQYDSYTGVPISETRFFKETKWPRHLAGQRLLEVGSGSGRFTEIAVKTGATVCSLDYSFAVEANYASNGRNPNLLIVQGDIYKMPFRETSFEKVLCIGVLQHTPDVKKSYLTLTRYLKPGGRITVDVYKRNDTLRGHLGKLVSTKYFVRPITRHIPPERLYKVVKGYINTVWPAARVINKIPKLGNWLNWRLLIADYRGVFPLSEEHLKEWAILDTFDMTSPKFDRPQTIATMLNWSKEAGLTEVESHYGYNGVECRGRRPGPDWDGPLPRTSTCSPPDHAIPLVI